ncbi:MAG: accessory Sec system translocase SecA2 [Acidobacteriota bacterium]|nr:accessory Sec system translocase SecA2 [Acidobacteriota bacterium]
MFDKDAPCARNEPGKGKRPKTALHAKLRTAFNKLRGIPLETDIADYEKTVEDIHAARLSRGPDRNFETPREVIADHPTGQIDPESSPREAAIETFALVFEAARGMIGLTPHDVQLIAGLAMSEGKIAELPTGEGKTLAAVFPAVLFARAGRSVHVLTFNDYLARRDAAWMGPIYRRLGLSVGVIQEGMEKSRKQTAYACDVVYATAKEAGFDYLRDRLAYEPGELVQRPFDVALVDEADSILIDEARTPLVISGIVKNGALDAVRPASAVRRLEAGRDYETDDERRNVYLTDSGLQKVENLLGCRNLFAEDNAPLLAAVYCALHAEALLERDVDYIVRNGRIEIVDEFTGRVMDKRHWPDGLQAAVEVKENLGGRPEGHIIGSITLQHFFGLYPFLCGMTATAASSVRELGEFYGTSVLVIPPHRPCIRRDFPDTVFTHKAAKIQALVRDLVRIHETSRPVLVGTSSVRESMDLAAALRAAGTACEVLNAANDEREAGIIARAGAPGAVTISTNMAGRGTDIRLGGPNGEEYDRVTALGGLHVIGTNRHESLRIDLQLRGRAGRQGDPGSSRFYISLEDDIFVKYGLSSKIMARHGLGPRDGDLDDKLLRREILHAQRVIEGRNFDIRRALRRYSSLLETQRQIVSGWRDAVLDPRSGIETPFRPSPKLEKEGSARFGPGPFNATARRIVLNRIDLSWADHLAALADLRESIHLVSLGRREPLGEFQKAATESFLGLQDRIEQDVEKALNGLVDQEKAALPEMESLRGPSSTWTYVLNEDQFGWGVEMLKGTNIGFSAGAAAVMGPLFIFTLLAARLKRNRSRKGKS